MGKRGKLYFVYILASRYGLLYTGMTSDLAARLNQHKDGTGSQFTSKFGISRLLYYECTSEVRSALEREKQIKAWRREKKLALIRSTNPEFRDLSEDWE